VGNIQAALEPLEGGPSLAITKDLTLIGRTADCDLRLKYRNVSKVHCVIVRTDGLLLLRDLGSTNGTRVNGQRVRRAALLPNDELSIANHNYRIVFGPAQLKDSPAQPGTQRLDTDEIEKMPKGGKQSTSKAPQTEGQAAQHINSLPDAYPKTQK
jgi:pSer/pThr/pTyr-binding forkhead associated (FHA) protein